MYTSGQKFLTAADGKSALIFENGVEVSFGKGGNTLSITQM